MRSYSRLSEHERDQIGILRAAGRPIGGIARALGRAKATISRELRRNAPPRGPTGYAPPPMTGSTVVESSCCKMSLVRVMPCCA